MPTITWDAAFELVPADTDEFKYGADAIRDLKLAISERLDIEHDFDATGLHRPGKVSAVYEGTTAQIAALTGMAAGAFAFDTDYCQWKRYSGSAWVLHSTVPTAAATGTDTITCTFSPAFSSLTNNTKVIVIAAGANTGAVTFAPNGLTAKAVVKGNNAALVAGDIPGQYYPIVLVYNSTLDKWVMANIYYTPVNQVAILQNRQVSGTGGGTATKDAWRDYPLNDEYEDPNSIVAGTLPEFELAAGTYRITGQFEFFRTSNSRIRLYNVTDAAVQANVNSKDIYSVNVYVNDSYPDAIQNSIEGTFIIAATKTLKLQYYTTDTYATTGLGYPASITDIPEVYGSLKIQKVA